MLNDDIFSQAILLLQPRAEQVVLNWFTENNGAVRLDGKYPLSVALDLFNRKDYSGAIKVLTPYLDQLGQDPTAPYRIHASVLLSRALLWLGRWDESVAVLESAQSAHLELSELETLAINWQMGNSYMRMRNYTEALKYYSKAYSISQKRNLAITANSIYTEMAAAILSTGDTARAIAMLEHALVSLSAYDSDEADSIIIKTRINLASALLFVGRYFDALHEYEMLAENSIVLSDTNLRLSVILNLAISYKRVDRLEESMHAYQCVLELARTSCNAEFEVRSLIGIANNFVKLKELTLARENAMLAYHTARANNVTSLFNETTIHMACVDREEGKKSEAIEGLRSAFDSMAEASDDNSAIIYGSELAEWMAEDGRFSEAFEIQKRCAAIQTAIYEKEIERTVELSALRSRLDFEREAIRHRDEERNKILHAVLPRHVAIRLMNGETRIADRLPDVSIMFADIVGFTTLATTKEPEELVGLLEDLFNVFDEVTGRFGCERIKTIGDSYMSCCGASESFTDHAERMCKAALAIFDAYAILPVESKRLRIGINSGPVVAGIMSGSRLSYDIWGDTVNVAARMEGHSEPGRIHCSAEVLSRVLGVPTFNFEKREPLDIRGKGLMTTYWLKTNEPVTEGSPRP